MARKKLDSKEKGEKFFEIPGGLGYIELIQIQYSGCISSPHRYLEGGSFFRLGIKYNYRRNAEPPIYTPCSLANINIISFAVVS